MTPLVSVSVITYNSSSTVEETLESVWQQTYQDIELIVSDDCSIDNTLDVCKDWIERHNDRFKRVVLLTAEHNTGISANINRAYNAARGVWIKEIAGDDLLLPTCIENFINYTFKVPDAYFIFGGIEAFGDNGQLVVDINNRFNNNHNFFILDKNEQHKSLFRVGNNLCAATFFYNRKKYHELGISNDERIPLLEDYPKWISITKSERLHYVDKAVVRYRVHEKSLTTSSAVSLQFKRSSAKFFLLYLFPYKIKHKPLLAIKHYILSKAVLSPGSFWDALSNLCVFYNRLKRKITRC